MSVHLFYSYNLDLSVDSNIQIRFYLSHTPMDSRVDYVWIRKSGFGVLHRHNTIKNLFSKQFFKPIGLMRQQKVPFLLASTSDSSAYILVQTRPSVHGSPPKSLRPIKSRSALLLRLS